MLSPDSQSPETTRINQIRVKKMMNPIKAPTHRTHFSKMQRMIIRTGHTKDREQQERRNPRHPTVNSLQIQILGILEAPILAPAEP